MLAGVIAEELLLPQEAISAVVDDDIFQLTTIYIDGYLLPEDQFDEGDIIYEGVFVNNLGAPQLYPSLVADLDVAGYDFTTAIIRALSAHLVSDNDVFYGPTVPGEVLSPQLFVDHDQFGGVAALFRYLLPPIAIDADGISDPIIQSGSTWVAIPHVVSADDLFFAPVTTRFVTPNLFADADVFFAPTRLPYLTPNAVLDDDVFLIPSVGGGILTTAPDLFTDADVFYAPLAIPDQFLLPDLFGDTDAFYAPTVGLLATQFLVADIVTDADAIPAPSIAVGAVTLAPSLFSDSDTFFVPVTSAAVTLAPSLFSDSDVFFPPTMAVGAITVTPSLFADGDTIFITVVGVPPTLATFDGVLANVTLSNGNLTATHSNTLSNSGARSAAAQGGVGKYYFEVTVGASHGIEDSIGIARWDTDYSNVAAANNSAIVYCNFGSGAIWAIGSSTGKTLGAIVAGNVIGIAVDLGNNEAWFRNGSGNWNGDAAANPVTGANGVAIPSTSAPSFVPVVTFGSTGTLSGDNFTANFGQVTYANTPPTGYSNWPPSNVMSAIADDSVLYAPTIIADQILAPSSFTDADAFYTPISTGGASVLTAGLFTDADAFFAPTVKALVFDGAIALDGPINPSVPQPTVILIEG